MASREEKWGAPVDKECCCIVIKSRYERRDGGEDDGQIRHGSEAKTPNRQQRIERSNELQLTRQTKIPPVL